MITTRQSKRNLGYTIGIAKHILQTLFVIIETFTIERDSYTHLIHPKL